VGKEGHLAGFGGSAERENWKTPRVPFLGILYEYALARVEPLMEEGVEKGKRSAEECSPKRVRGRKKKRHV